MGIETTTSPGTTTRRLCKSENIIINIPAGSTLTRYYFPDLPNLRNVHLWSFEAYCQEILPVSWQNVRTPGLTIIQQSFLTLQTYNGKEAIHQLPLINLLNMSTPAFTEFPSLFTGQKINYPKSYIDLASAAVLPPAPGAQLQYTFTAYYTESRAIEAKDRTASFANRS